MAKKERYIKLDKDKVKEIADIKGVSTVTVYAALKFQTDSALAMLIRAWCLKKQRILIVKLKSNKEEIQ